MSIGQIVECVPNFSEGRDEAVIEQICTASQPLGIQSQVLTLSQEAHPIEHNAVTVHRAHLDLELASTGFSWQFI